MRDNPAHAEWVLMEYLPSKTLDECLPDLKYDQCLRFANGLTQIVSSLFKLTSKYLGSLFCDLSSKDNHRALAYLNPFPEEIPTFHTRECEVDRATVLIGPLNELSLIDNPERVPVETCGPCGTEGEFIRCCTWKGETREPQAIPLMEKFLEMFDIIKPFCRAEPHLNLPDESTSSEFHFAHGDLTHSNILINRHRNGSHLWYIGLGSVRILSAVAAV